MERQPTIKDVAVKAGVSANTVSKVLRGEGSISAETADRVRRVVEEIGYAPNAWARSMVSKRTNLLAMVTTGFHDDFSYGVFHGVQEYARERGYVVLVGITEGDPEVERVILRRFLELRVQGYICMAERFDGRNETYGILLGQNRPVVFFTRYPEGLPCDRVLTDDEQGGYLAARHLLELGHGRIVFLTAPALLQANDHRNKVAGVRRAMTECGLSLEDGMIIPFSSEEKFPAILKVLSGKNRPTGVVCITDYKCVQLYQRLCADGWNIPQDLSLVGYDDIQAASLISPPLTTVRVPKRELGLAAARLLIDRIENPKKIRGIEERLLQPELVIRGSTAPPSFNG
ncbi:MAG: LacI family DNA-binding transcriptional regulator [Bacillota bacterium]